MRDSLFAYKGRAWGENIIIDKSDKWVQNLWASWKLRSRV